MLRWYFILSKMFGRSPDLNCSSVIRHSKSKYLFTFLRLIGLILPDVLSGARNFPMSTDLKIFLKQLMTIGTQTDVWLVSGGVQEGIVKHLGVPMI